MQDYTTEELTEWVYEESRKRKMARADADQERDMRCVPIGRVIDGIFGEETTNKGDST